jgi:hypothetical protein
MEFDVPKAGEALASLLTNRARRRLEEVLGPLSLIREEH